MGIQHLLLLLIYLDPLNVLLCAATKTKNTKNIGSPRRNPKGNSTVVTPVHTPKTPKIKTPKPGSSHETCLSYIDVSEQVDKEFECNNTNHRYCCGSCLMRFCCDERAKRLDQSSCKNTIPPIRVETTTPGPVEIDNSDVYDPRLDQTNTTVYITCGVIAFIIIAGIAAKVAYDKTTSPPQEMNVHRALADILRQQGPIPLPHYERENVTAIDGSPKDNTPIRTSKNHYTPVRTTKTNHGHYGKDSFRSGGGGPDLHNFISSGFVTLGRGQVKGDHQWPTQLMSQSGDHQHNYNHLMLASPTHTPTNEKPRMNSILTSATEPYDLSFSRSFQSLSHLPPSYESAVKSDLSKYSSLKRLSDKEVDDYYTRKRHLPDLAARGTLPLHILKMSQEQQGNHRERPRRVQRAMSQDRVLSPERAPPQEYGTPYGGRILSDEQLLSAERLHSQDPLLSPDKVMSLKRSGFREKSMSRALSHTDVFVSTPVMDRYKMTKMHSHPSASNNLYNTLSMNQTATKRQAFASRRTHTVEQLQYIPGHHHHYRTASKTEVTV
ncbi:protein shisa-6 isoform X1 [Polypterus senegalus]|uniref:protein shisa-6 isoform X1 n=1 Tax=Polypterus senegalus TaxID=55291 RepID=UPI0019625F18|nr:protein shisa-6 isoform X1 [Polypterus senegalus]XP_039596021.1 protein shisa-6 isoform X1 [Polypterus senegalus]